MGIDWEPLREIIDSNQRFVLSSHVRPDADALGSELGLAAILESRGKSVRIVNPSASPANLDFLDPEKRVKKIGNGMSIEDACDTDVHIVVDTSAWTQLVDVGKVLKQTSAKKVVIDHHVSSDDLDAVEFKNTKAEATGALIFQLAETLETPITEETATALFCAIATDTGWFRFPSTSSETMRIIGRLIDFGAKPHLIYQLLYERYSAARVKLAGRILSRLNVECDGRLAYICVELKDFKETGAVPADTEDIVNECLRISGTECAFIAIEQRNQQVKVSFRSRTVADVAKVAEQFGGGGHKQAAGAILPGPLADALAKVLTSMKAAIEG